MVKIGAHVGLKPMRYVYTDEVKHNFQKGH